MKRSNLLTTVAAFGVVAAPLYLANAQTPAPVPKFKSEQCYGVVKAGRNDCQTRNSSCAGTAKRDQQADAWVYVPAGVCSKLVGGQTKVS